MSNERCPLCAGHGVLSRQVGRSVAPGVHEYETREVPCPRCS